MNNTNRTGDGKFKPGHSGNPKGRPPNGREFAWALRRIAHERDGDGSRLDAVIRKLFAQAKDGDTASARLIAERLDGKPAESPAGESDEEFRLAANEFGGLASFARPVREKYRQSIAQDEPLDARALLELGAERLAEQAAK